MCDWDDDFDDFGDDGFMDEDSFEDEFNEFADDQDDMDSESDTEEPIFDEFNVSDAVFIGGAIFGNAYEEAMDERKRRELLRKKQTTREK